MRNPFRLATILFATAAPVVAQTPVCYTDKALAITSFRCPSCSIETRDGYSLFVFEAEPVVLAAVAGSGIAANDVLIAIDGKPITTRDAGAIFSRPRPGTTKLQLRRNGARIDVDVPVTSDCAPQWGGLTVTADRILITNRDSTGKTTAQMSGSRISMMNGVFSTSRPSFDGLWSRTSRNAVYDDWYVVQRPGLLGYRDSTTRLNYGAWIALGADTSGLWSRAQSYRDSSAALRYRRDSFTSYVAELERMARELDSIAARMKVLRLDTTEVMSATARALYAAKGLQESARALSEAAGSVGSLGFAIACDDACMQRRRSGDQELGFREPPRVQAVRAGGPAAVGGLRAGDVITAVDGKSITTYDGSNAFVVMQGPSRPSNTVRLTVTRDGKQLDITLKLPPGTNK